METYSDFLFVQDVPCNSHLPFAVLHVNLFSPPAVCSVHVNFLLFLLSCRRRHPSDNLLHVGTKCSSITDDMPSRKF